MHAIILAGGLGTRLRPIVSELPKSMALISGRPFLEILLNYLQKNNFKEITVCVGYLSDKIIDHFGNYFNGISLHYEIESHPLGTGGATKLGLRNSPNDYSFVFNGDTYFEANIREMIDLWEEHKCPIVASRVVSETDRYGKLILDKNRILKFSEKSSGGPGIINGGCYLLPKNCLDDFDNDKKFSLENDYFSPLVLEHKVLTSVAYGKFIDIGIPKDYMKAQIELSCLKK